MIPMQVEITFEYVLEFCVSEELCETLNIELPANFLLKSVEINAEKSSLSHLCSCNIKIDGESVTGHYQIDEQNYLTKEFINKWA